MTKESDAAEAFAPADDVPALLEGFDGPPLDSDQVEKLIFDLDGDVTLIAREMKVRSDRMRAFILASGKLRRALDEVFERALDESLRVMFAGLRDGQSFQNRFYAAKEFLRSAAAKKRGFGSDSGPQAQIEVKTPGSGRTIVLKWLEPDETEEPKVIDHE